MTPPAGSVPTQSHSTEPLQGSDDAGHLERTDQLDRTSAGSRRSPASYWVRRQSAEALRKLSA